MSLIDDLLGPLAEHVIDDGEGGKWVVSLRPRRNGDPVARTTSVSFRRIGERPGRGFGIQVWALRSVARSGEWGDPVAEASIGLTRKMAQDVITWADTLGG